MEAMLFPLFSDVERFSLDSLVVRPLTSIEPDIWNPD